MFQISRDRARRRALFTVRRRKSIPVTNWTPTEVLVHAISDGINIYIRDVLIPRGVADKEAWGAAGVDSDLIRLKYEVAAKVAASWVESLCSEDT
jgi:hypothetical protein